MSWRKMYLLAAVMCGLWGTTLAATTAFSNIENMSTGWQSCTACAGGGDNATYYSMKQGLMSPSLDGSSAEFHVGGGTAYSNGLWWRRMSSDTTATHFVLDMQFYMNNPSAAQGLEFAANQAVNGEWYKFSTQCSFSKGVWSAWDSQHGGWVATAVPCVRPTPYTWTHMIFEYARSSGKAVFVAFTINGVKHYVNKSFSPQPTSASGSVGVHFQLDGNKTMAAYSVWVDKMGLTYW